MKLRPLATSLATTLATSALLALTIGAAHAATSTQNLSFAEAATPWSQNAMLAQFDPTAGTLNSVTLSFGGVITTVLKMENKSSSASEMSVDFNGLLSMMAPDGSMLSAATGTLSHHFSAAAYDGISDYAGASGISYAPEKFTVSQSAHYDQLAALAPFIGNGNLSAPMSSSASTVFSASGDRRTSARTQADGWIKLTYDYTPTVTPVPEPGAWALMIAGLGAFGLLRTRRGHRG